MSSSFGNSIKISLFGQSHSEGIGVVIDGLPAGKKLNFEEITRFLARRAPGGGVLTTARSEKDRPHILSGLVDGTTCGAPLCAVFINGDAHSADYDAFREVPRPAHADYPAHVKYGGFNDIRGGGHFSARLTAPLCFAGAVCAQLLREEGIEIAAHIASIGGIEDSRFSPADVTGVELQKLRAKVNPVLDDGIFESMCMEILSAKEAGDSVGGTVECCVTGLPVGIGEPIFDGLENKIAAAAFAIPAVKGIEFGNGFECAALRGSQNNDPFYFDGGSVKTRTNNCGGIQGGLSNGMPLIFRLAFKPTPSIALEQDSVNLSSKQNVKLTVEGRHDPCVVLRAVPCVEAAAAIAVYDLFRSGV
ncbi:MAG: chorismate synthase [Ruminococcaceae bacterium]|nr:chorismate synthase [Oscillospiraceae bacterium]